MTKNFNVVITLDPCSCEEVDVNSTKRHDDKPKKAQTASFGLYVCFFIIIDIYLYSPTIPQPSPHTDDNHHHQHLPDDNDHHQHLLNDDDDHQHLPDDQHQHQQLQNDDQHYQHLPND